MKIVLTYMLTASLILNSEWCNGLKNVPSGGVSNAIQREPRENSKCPNEVLIVPCTCSITVYGPELNCSAVKSEDQLADVFQQDFPDKNFYRFIISDNYAIKELDNIFNGVSFQEIAVEYSALEKMAPGAFEDSKKTLASSYLAFGALTDQGLPVDWDEYEFLVNLYLNNNLLTSVSGIKSKSLDGIDFSNNNISSITKDVLAGTPNIHQLHLFNNSLSSIQAGTFNIPDVDEFWLDLRNNQIEELQVGAIAMPPEPSSNFQLVMSLDHNLLTDISEEVFGPLINSTVLLSLPGNPLDCDCDIAWIVENEDYKSKLDGKERCYNGTLVTSLDPSYYAHNC